jgi:hypothetical protein
MTPEVIEAQRAIARLRSEISTFQRLRTKNNEIISGMKAGKVPWDQARQIAETYRDPGMEEHTVGQLGELIKLLRQGETGENLLTLEDPLPPGIENGLGWLPWVAGAVIAAATATYSGFAFMRTREEVVLEQTRGPVLSAFYRLGENTWALAALGVVALGGVIYYDIRFRSLKVVNDYDED